MKCIEEKIDILLEDDVEFKKYINKIENGNSIIPKNLNKKILNNINVLKQKNNKKPINKYKFIDFLKISCFTVLTLLIWEIGYPNLNNLEYGNFDEKIELLNISNQKENISQKIGDFFLSPVNTKINK
jgi:hypothetical protein